MELVAANLQAVPRVKVFLMVLEEVAVLLRVTVAVAALGKAAVAAAEVSLVLQVKLQLALVVMVGMEVKVDLLARLIQKVMHRVTENKLCKHFISRLVSELIRGYYLAIVFPLIFKST